MRLSRLGSLLAGVVVALCGVGMYFSVQGQKDAAGIFIGLSLVGALSLDAATRHRVNRLTRS